MNVNAGYLLAMRERLHMSRPVLARYLRTNTRTLRWEQGRAKTKRTSGAVDTHVVEQFPDTIERLAKLEAVRMGAAFCRLRPANHPIRFNRMSFVSSLSMLAAGVG